MGNQYIKSGQNVIIRTCTPVRGEIDFIIDKDDFDRVKNFHWTPMKFFSGKVYATTTFRQFENGKTRLVSMSLHQLIASFESEVIDHKNGDTLLNTKANLRPCTKKENTRNRVIQKNNTSGFKGVCYNKKNSKFCSSIRVDGKAKYLGSFIKKEDAAIAYNDAATKYHKEFACLNTITQNPATVGNDQV